MAETDEKDFVLKSKEGEGSTPLRVLNVEDDDALRKMGERKLTLQKMKFSSAASGDDALAILKNDHGFGILYSDIQLPGMSGIALARKAKEINPNIVVILTSGGPLEDENKKALKDEGVMDFFISKPHSFGEFNNVLSEASELAQARGSSSEEPNTSL